MYVVCSYWLQKYKKTFNNPLHACKFSTILPSWYTNSLIFSVITLTKPSLYAIVFIFRFYVFRQDFSHY